MPCCCMHYYCFTCAHTLVRLSLDPRTASRWETIGVCVRVRAWVHLALECVYDNNIDNNISKQRNLDLLFTRCAHDNVHVYYNNICLNITHYMTYKNVRYYYVVGIPRVYKTRPRTILITGLRSSSGLLTGTSGGEVVFGCTVYRNKLVYLLYIIPIM